MILLKMLPGVLKELVKHVPTVLFRAVEWNDLASELPRLSRRVLQKEGYAGMLSLLGKHLSPFGITITDLPFPPAGGVTASSGERVLEIYFAQLFSSEGLFIDLRSQHFKEEDDRLLWHPTGFWTKFSEEFRLGLLDVYEGFYLEDEVKHQRGLKAIGLLKDEWPPEDKDKLSQLFKAQFGGALGSDMAFELDHFREAILKMSEFILQKGVIISKDFLYLGIYLVTLYSHLEQGHHKYPVKGVYLKVRKTFSPP